MARRWARLASVAVLLAAGCTTGRVQPPLAGSTKTVVSPVPVSSFTRLEVESGFVVNLSLGPATSVKLLVNKNVLGVVDVRVSGHTLHIGLKPGARVQTVILRAAVSTPHLTAITVGGAAIVSWGDYLQSPSLDVSASGSAALEGPIEVYRARVKLSGGANVGLMGDANALDVQASGASVLSALPLHVTNLTVDLSGASHVGITASGSISATLSGASSLQYYESYGKPTFTHKNVSGGSTIETGP